MPHSHYESELAKLPETYAAARKEDVASLRSAIAAASASSILGVGSGASYTVASLLCGLHEQYTGRVSRPSTPLEIICNPNLAAASPVFLLTAEGKNPDIVEALRRARRHSARAVHVITNRAQCPVMDCAKELTDVNPHVFEMTAKDGYLGTNSLLMDSVVVAKAYQELDKGQHRLPPSMGDLLIGDSTLTSWMAGGAAFAQQVASRGALIVLYSPRLHAVAIDLESKLAEAALAHCQLADFRSFAHGRHLWLGDRPQDCCILALVDQHLERLWQHLSALLPPEVPTLTMSSSGDPVTDLLAGLIAQMHLVAGVASALGKDPACPTVPQFGRDIHYADLPALIPAPADEQHSSETSKYEVLGGRWPIAEMRSSMSRALAAFRESIEQRKFRALVFDYDGVLCRSQERDRPPPRPILDHLVRLASAGIIIGVASGRGGSVQAHLRESLPEALWPRILLGLYNAGHIGDVSVVPVPGKTSEYLSHVTRIVRKLKAIGVPITVIKPTHPFQVSVRFGDGVDADSNWFVIADAMRQAGLDLSRAVKSKHSVDILAPGVNKSHLIAHIIQHFNLDPYDVLTMGDQGAWPGNDSSLLDHRFSLSVDQPSRRLDRGWKLAPSHKRDVDATLWYLDRIKPETSGSFRVSLSQFSEGLPA